MSLLKGWVGEVHNVLAPKLLLDFTKRLGYGFRGGISALNTVLTLVGGPLLLVFGPSGAKKIG